MFDKLKQINELRKIQQKMKEERVEINEKGISLVINGNFELEKIVLNPELSTEEQAETLKSCFNQAVKSIQLKVAQGFSHLI